jgi:dTDP-4-amino-4,6-dideoxygalactose transaminase
MSPIQVTKSFLPPIEEFQEYIARIWATAQLTNQGPLLREFEDNVKAHLGLTDSNLHFVSNGTIALQLALRALDITDGEVITTPFSYVATASAILWERCTPVFVDVDPETFCLDPALIEDAITDRTRAILPVHVFGNAADVVAISHIAEDHALPVIYDGAHAFGARLHGRSVLGYGDVATASFHATKAFHTIEGGAVVTRDTAVHERLELLKRFGHNLDDHVMLGINGKASEFSAAMGLVNLHHIDEVIAQRRALVELYDRLLGGRYGRQRMAAGLEENYAYYPIVFDSEAELLRSQRRLNTIDVWPRRYFFPSLNTLPYLTGSRACPVSESLAHRVMCLPLYPGLEHAAVEKISAVLPA